jgi:hypothetical protein
MSFWFRFNAVALGSAVALSCPTFPVLAQSAHYQQVKQDIAIETAVNVSLYPGRTTTIDFSQTQEVISYVGLGDASRVVFHTDTDLERGRGKTIFLQPIQPLDFPGATTAVVTNLVVKTVTPAGEHRLYHFQLVPEMGTPNHLGIQIIPDDTLDLGSPRALALAKVERGLRVAIRRGYTPVDDPVVSAVRRFITVARTQEMALPEAARVAGVKPMIIVELVKLGREGEL